MLVCLAYAIVFEGGYKECDRELANCVLHSADGRWLRRRLCVIV